jgi:hypothetical protein
MSAQVGALVEKMSLLSTCIAVPFRLRWVLSSLGPLNILSSSSRSLEIVGALNHLTLWETTLAQLTTALAETTAEQDETQV